jgi:hypothetical protein
MSVVSSTLSFMSSSCAAEEHAVSRIVATLHRELDDAVDAPLWSLRDVEVSELLEQAHAASARLAALTLRLTTEAGRRDLPSAAGAPNTRAWLRGRLRLSPGAAKRVQLLSERLETGCQATGAALGAGSIDADQAQVITRVVAELPKGTDAALVADAEQRLISEAATFDAVTLARLGDRILELVDPDGADARLGDALAREEARYRRRELSVCPDLDGMVRIRGRLDAEAGALLSTALDPLAAPRPSDANGPDTRSSGQRYADALTELARRALDTGQLSATGGYKPQLAITCDYDTLTSRLGVGTLDTGGHLSAAALRRIACDAMLVPAILDSRSVPLDFGRRVRLIPAPLRRALILRDRGCAFPDCTRRPAWCDAHHIKHWVDGGQTSLDNAVLLCGYHHRLIHKGEWRVRSGADRHPDFLPPEWIDPVRKPLRNTMHVKHERSPGHSKT